MTMKRTIYLLFLAAVVSCRGEIMLPLDGPEVMPVMNARLSTADAEHEVTVDYSYLHGTKEATDASVKMILNGNSIEAKQKTAMRHDEYAPAPDPTNVYTVHADIVPGDVVELVAETPYGKASSKTTIPEYPRIQSVKIDGYNPEKKILRASVRFDDDFVSGYYLVESWLMQTAIIENTGELEDESSVFCGSRVFSDKTIRRNGALADVVYGEDDITKIIKLDNHGIPHSMRSDYQTYDENTHEFVMEKVWYSRKVDLRVRVSAISQEDYFMLKDSIDQGIVLDFGTAESIRPPMNVEGGLGLVCPRSCVEYSLPFMEQSHYSVDDYPNVPLVWVWK